MTLVMNAIPAGHTSGNDKTSPVHSLAILSSIAMMMTGSETDTRTVPNTTTSEAEVDRTLQQTGKCLSRSFSRMRLNLAEITKEVDDPQQQCDRRKKPKKSGGMSRSASMRNLGVESIESSSCRGQQGLQQKQRSQDEKEPMIHSAPSLIAYKQVPSQSETNQETVMSDQSCDTNERVRQPMRMEAAETTEAACDLTENNVYRSYEMHVPEPSSLGPIMFVPTTDGRNATNSDMAIDDYNNDVYVCTPLYAPRLPNPQESLHIATRSQEERNNWGWYAE